MIGAIIPLPLREGLGVGRDRSPSMGLREFMMRALSLMGAPTRTPTPNPSHEGRGVV